MRNTSFGVLPIFRPTDECPAFIARPQSCFFEQAALERQIGHALLQARASRRRSCTSPMAAARAALVGLQELFGPGVAETLGDAFLTIKLGDAVFAAQTIQHDPDLILGRGMPPDLSSHVLHHRFHGGLDQCFSRGSGASSSFLRHYDEAKNLLKSQHQICAIRADGEHADIMPRLIEFANAFVGRARGGLGHATMIAAAGLSTVSGAAVADASARSGTLIPELRKAYGLPFASAVVAAAANLGLIIPRR